MKIFSLGLAASIILFSAFYLITRAWRFQGWHNNDELAHVDYVYRLAHDFRLPTSTEPVHRELVEFSSQYFSYPEAHKLALPDYGIGLQAYSYEAHQPMLYYLVLAAPEALLDWLRVPLILRLKILRLVSVAFILAGWLLFFSALRLFQKEGWLSLLSALWLTALLAFFSAGDHYHVSNDQMGLLWGALLTRNLIQAGFSPDTRALAQALTFWALATATKLSNALWIVPIAGFYGQMFYAGSVQKHTFKAGLLTSLWPLLFLVPLAWKYFKNDSDAISETARLFSIITPGLFDGRFFIEAFVYKAFNADVLGIVPGADWPYVIILWMACASFLWIYLGGKLVLQQAGVLWLILTWPVVFFAAAFLNRHVGSVFWFEFRIFTAFYPVLIMFLGLPAFLWRNINE
jgi:hypothetical protein